MRSGALQRSCLSTMHRPYRCIRGLLRRMAPSHNGTSSRKVAGPTFPKVAGGLPTPLTFLTPPVARRFDDAGGMQCFRPRKFGAGVRGRLFHKPSPDLTHPMPLWNSRCGAAARDGVSMQRSGQCNDGVSPPAAEPTKGVCHRHSKSYANTSAKTSPGSNILKARHAKFDALVRAWSVTPRQPGLIRRVSDHVE